MFINILHQQTCKNPHFRNMTSSFKTSCMSGQRLATVWLKFWNHFSGWQLFGSSMMFQQVESKNIFQLYLLEHLRRAVNPNL